jgi:hypothetical protein
MTQFGLAGKDVPHIADLLAAGADKALGSVADLSEALKYGGLAAHQAGFNIKETVGTLAEFAQAGLMGSSAGRRCSRCCAACSTPSRPLPDDEAVRHRGLQRERHDEVRRHRSPASCTTRSCRWRPRSATPRSRRSSLRVRCAARRS